VADTPSSQELSFTEALALANDMRERGELSAAEQLCREIAAQTPAAADLLHLQALIAAHRKRPQDAIKYMLRALCLAPDAEEFYRNFVNICRLRFGAQADRHLQDFDTAFRDPAIPDTAALTRLLISLGEIDHAVALVQQWHAAGRASAKDLQTVGYSLNETGAFAAAYRCFALAHQLAPEDPKIARFLATATMRQGDLAGGLALYERRWDLKFFRTVFRDYPFPVWQGEPLKDRALLAWTEQGIGDQIMQSRAVALLGKTADLAVECDPRLFPLLQRSFPDARYHAQTVEPDPDLISGAFDFHTSLLSAWRWLLPDGLRPPAAAPYLTADAARVEALRQHWGMGAKDGPLHVGLSWRSKQADRGPGRSVDPFVLAPLLSDRRLKVYSLQYDASDAEIAELNRDFGTGLIAVPDIDMKADLDGVAALMTALDLVISVDNTTVHLAGALGRPTWVMLNHRHDWRWLDGGPTTPLYESLRLYRQTAKGQWGDVLISVATDLEDLLARR